MNPENPLRSVLIPTTLLTAAICFAQSQPLKPDAPAASPKQFDYRCTTLDNGLKIITLEDFSSPIVAVQVWYQVGSKDEQPDRQGYAHMFEHMMFKGTDHVGSDDHFSLIRKVGGTCNAYTSFDQTVYTETLPARELELALWLEAERMAFLKIDQNAFDTERRVVEEELRMGENRPYGNVFKKMAAELFTVHPYHWTPIGNIAHLRATSVGDLRTFWNRYYLPNNATLILVGAVKHEQAEKMARRYFGWIPAGPESPRITIQEPEPSSARTIIIDDENAPAGQVSLAWRTVPTGHADETALECLSAVLGGGKSSRVYRRLVAESQLAVEAESGSETLQQAGLFFISATLPPTAENYETVLQSLSEQLEVLQTKGVGDEELEKAKNQLLKNRVTATLSVESKAHQLGTAAVTMGNLSRVNTQLDDIRAVTRDDIRRVAGQWLGKDRVFRFIIQKSTEGMLTARKDNENTPITAEPELLSPPPGREGVVRPAAFAAQAPFAKSNKIAFNLPFKEAKLPNGLTVIAVSNHEVPFVSVMLGIRNGAWTEEKPGTAAMTLAMLTRGTAQHTEAELATTLEQYAITLDGAADKDNATVSMDCLTEHLERGMTLMAETVLAPTFDKDEFAKLMTQEISRLQILRQDPRYLAETGFHKVVFGEHPYSRPATGTPQQLGQISPEDLTQWWKKFARPDQSSLIFAGDITLPKALKLAEASLGNWKSGPLEEGLSLPAIPEPQPTHITLIDRPGSVQAQLYVGHLGITRRQQPDYFYGLITGNYFGGSFNSRLNDNLRVKRGLTYGAHGGFNTLNQAGTFEMSTFTKNESVVEALHVILEQIRQFQTVPPTKIEFGDTRSFLFGSFARNREMPQQVARDLWMMESQNLSRDYFKQLFATLGKATPKDCTALTQKVIHPERLSIIVVGDAAALKENLEKIAPVQVVAVQDETP